LGIKEKRHEKVKEGGCMERNIQIGNKWWKIMTIYSKELKTTGRGVEDTIKENREECMLMEGERKIQRQGGKCRGEEIDGMD
jgi:hypothetical protein